MGRTSVYGRGGRGFKSRRPPVADWPSAGTRRQATLFELDIVATDFSDSSAILATVSRILDAEGLTQAATVLKAADARFERTGYDNWNGGTDLYTLFLQVDAASYRRLGPAREDLEQPITERLKPVIDGFSDDWVSAQIRPRVESPASWKSSNTRARPVRRRGHAHLD